MTPTDSLQNRRVLVTGASGFIGLHLCERLLRDGCAVTGVSRQHPGNIQIGITKRQADLADPAAVEHLVAECRPEIIFHLSSCVTGNRAIDLVRPTFAANLASTVYLMESAARHQCRRFVLAGSLEEPDPQQPPSSPYAASKAAATAYARMFHALYGFPAVIARIFMVYGPNQLDKTKLVPYVIETLLKGEAPRLSSGTRLVDWIYVADVVEGLLRLAIGENLAGKTVDLGTGILTPVRTVVEKIATRIDPAIRLNFDPAGDRPMEQVRAADVQASRTLAGWFPFTTVDEGLDATIRWHRQQANLPDRS